MVKSSLKADKSVICSKAKNYKYISLKKRCNMVQMLLEFDRPSHQELSTVDSNSYHTL